MWKSYWLNTFCYFKRFFWFSWLFSQCTVFRLFLNHHSNYVFFRKLTISIMNVLLREVYITCFAWNWSLYWFPVPSFKVECHPFSVKVSSALYNIFSLTCFLISLKFWAKTNLNSLRYTCLYMCLCRWYLKKNYSHKHILELWFGSPPHSSEIDQRIVTRVVMITPVWVFGYCLAAMQSSCYFFCKEKMGFELIYYLLTLHTITECTTIIPEKQPQTCS